MGTEKPHHVWVPRRYFSKVRIKDDDVQMVPVEELEALIRERLPCSQVSGMDYEKFWKALLEYGVLKEVPSMVGSSSSLMETSELKTWMRHMESVWKIHGSFDVEVP